MTILDFTQAGLTNLITHHVGNKLRDENIKLTDESSLYSEETKDFLLRYFLLRIKAEEFYEFTHPIKLEMNDVYSIVKNMFNEHNVFIPHSKDLAKLLYENSMHPKIKGGELNITYFTNVVLDDEIVDAIGIYKSETVAPFLKMKIGKSKYDINHEFGFEIKGVDKGCIIFNTEQKTGFKVLVIDNSNKSVEAQYWKDDFLKLKPIANEFHQTNQFLGIAKNFVTKQLDEEFEVSKADKIDLLNRSVEYFKTHETFEKKQFEHEVFQDSVMIKSFRNFDDSYRQENQIEVTDNFDISVQAVKKQARVFKKVLKLDKNFHIYIHGNRDMIEQGVDKDGRKFYKIYYSQES
jgi:hypothetical protein